MKAVDSNIPSETGGDRAERSRLLREFFLNAAMLAVMKETVDEAVELEQSNGRLPVMRSERFPCRRRDLSGHEPVFIDTDTKQKRPPKTL